MNDHDKEFAQQGLELIKMNYNIETNRLSKEIFEAKNKLSIKDLEAKDLEDQVKVLENKIKKQRKEWTVVMLLAFILDTLWSFYFN